MERICKNCLLPIHNGGICPVFREKMNPEEKGCPKFVNDLSRFCESCGNPILGKGTLAYTSANAEKPKYICDNCASIWGTCRTCQKARYCDFEMNTSVNLPKQVQQQIRQGNMIAQTVVRNKAREAETCAKNCVCWDKENEICWREWCEMGGCEAHWEPLTPNR